MHELRLRDSPLLRPYAMRCAFADWPPVTLYNAFMRAGAVRTRSGYPVCFRDAAELSDVLAYEQRIYETGVVATRSRNAHDLFNALAWSLFPAAKAALNARHYDEMGRGPAASANERTRARDALTLLDESGVIVASDTAELLELIRAMRWKDLFWRRRAEVIERMRFIVFGHGLCEQALRPYVGLTAKALLLAVSPEVLVAREEQQTEAFDGFAAAWCGRVDLTPNDLHPLPVLGVPGWWPDNERESFYDNTGYFRTRRGRLRLTQQRG